MRQPPEKLDTGWSSGETEAEEQGFRPRPHGVDVRIGERRVQLRHPGAVLRLFQLGLQRPQLAVPVDGVFHRRTIERRRLLRHVRHAPVLRHVEVALVGVQLVAQQREQARLAGAVGPDQAGVVAWIQREVGLLEQDLGAAPEGELRKTNQMLEDGLDELIR
jgi:hypothetical protein